MATVIEFKKTELTHSEYEDVYLCEANLFGKDGKRIRYSNSPQIINHLQERGYTIKYVDSFSGQ